MKIMTCRELGGACDQKLSANTWDEMVQKVSKHVNEDPKKWGREMKPKFDNAQERQSATS